MAATVKEAFVELSRRLEVTDPQASTMSTRQQNVRAAMERGFQVLDSFLGGSYARSTMIGPLDEADIDIFVILDPKYFRSHTPAALLNETRDVVRKTYPATTGIRPDGQAVTIPFADFKVDVVPCFNRQGGGYLIPDSSAGAWVSTNPDAHATLLTTRNKAHAGDLVPLIKMIKGWNRTHGGRFVGFYLELLTGAILENVTISDLASGVRYVFDKGREKVKFKQRDPADYGGQVNGLARGTVDEAVQSFASAYNSAVRAEAHASTGNVRAAIAEWKALFGDYFPAYG